MANKPIEQQKAIRLERAKALVTAFEDGDDHQVEVLLDEIVTIHETVLYQKVGRLTRQLHDALAGFSWDCRMTDLTENEIPDAKERLNYVINMTQQAADTTLNVIEELVPISEQMESDSNDLSLKWEKFRQRDMPFDEFNSVSDELTRYFSKSTVNIKTIQSKLTEVLMAQGFQDITGQIIRRVINLVQDLEHNMVELVCASGGHKENANNQNSKNSMKLEGPVVPGVNNNDSATSQNDVDELLSSLGF